MRALAAAALALAASAPARGAALPERPVPDGHPCRLANERFTSFAAERGVDVALARLAGGAIVLRARASLDAPPSRVGAILEDVARWPSWIRRLRSLEPLSGEPPSFHAVFRAPWPLSDRDYAFAPAAERRPGETVVFWEDASGGLAAPAAGRARVSPVRGCFAVTPGASERASALVYTELDSFGAGLPEWMRRSGWRRGPIRLVEGLRAKLGEN